MWTAVRAAALTAEPWRNGRGTSRTIATRLTPSGTLLWQVGIADLDSEAEFSDYTGFDRIFTPISGGGVELAFDDGGYASCPLLQPLAFRGEQRTRCRLPNGPARAFNAIWDRAARAGSVAVLRVDAEAKVETLGATCMLHCWDGAMSIGAHRLAAGDSCYGVGGPYALAITDSVVLRVSLSLIGVCAD